MRTVCRVWGGREGEDVSWSGNSRRINLFRSRSTRGVGNEQNMYTVCGILKTKHGVNRMILFIRKSHRSESLEKSALHDVDMEKEGKREINAEEKRECNVEIGG